MWGCFNSLVHGISPQGSEISTRFLKPEACGEWTGENKLHCFELKIDEGGRE